MTEVEKSGEDGGGDDSTFSQFKITFKRKTTPKVFGTNKRTKPSVLNCKSAPIKLILTLSSSKMQDLCLLHKERQTSWRLCEKLMVNVMHYAAAVT